MPKVIMLFSAVININDTPLPFGKGAVVEVSEETLRDNWQLMRPVGYRETMKIDPAIPIIAQKVSQKATIKATEVRHRK